ncbi:MAG: tetratricopeptide repeat protein [Acidobacteriota bacterium]|jgi:tetratricopeptide (TPR) repeat protein|nr:tetratricopeptide repeat protein [Acidobacteriota bacterium]
MTTPRIPPRTWPWLAALLAVAVYLPSLPASFQFDDWQSVLGDERVFSLSAWWRSMPGMRALLKLTYALNHGVCGEPCAGADGDAAGFRAVNILIHALNTALLYMLAQKLAQRLGRADERAARVVGAVTALAFALHPVQTETVTYIAGRSGALATLGVLAASLAWLRGREAGAGRWWPALAALAFVAALAGKETAAVLPLGMALCLFAEPAMPRLRDFALPLALLALEAALLAAAWRRLPYGHLLDTSLGVRSPLDNLAAQAQGVPWLVGQLLDWSRLNADPMLQPAAQWTAGTAAAAAALAAVCVGAALSLRRHPVPAFAILWFFLWLAPTNSLLARLDVANDRQLYLALAGPAWLLGHAVARLGRKAAPGTAGGVSRGELAAMAALAALLAAGTASRNRVYATEVSFWRDVVSKSPHNARAWNNLGYAEALACRPDEARQAFEEAVRRDPGYPQPQVNLELLEAGELPGEPGRCRDE